MKKYSADNLEDKFKVIYKKLDVPMLKLVL